MRKPGLIMTGILLLALLSPLPAGAQENPLAVGTDQSLDGMIVGQLIIRLLQSRGFSCQDLTGLGSGALVRNALINGQIDLYPAYSGEVLERYLGQADPGQGARAAFDAVRSGDLAQNSLVWLEMTDLEKVPTVWLRGRLARSRGLASISDLAAWANSRSEKPYLGMSPDFLVSEKGFRTLAKAYGLALPKDRIIKMDRLFLYQALREKAVDAVIGSSLDPGPVKYKLTPLKDDKGFFRPNNASAVVRQETAQKHPNLKPILSELSLHLTPGQMGRLIRQVLEGAGPEQAAAQWLKEKGLVGK